MDDKKFLCEVATKFSQFFTHMNDFCNRYIQQYNGGPPLTHNGFSQFKPSFLSSNEVTRPRARRRTDRDPRAPKKIRSAYNFFCQQRRTKLLEKNPNLTFQELSKLLGNEWHNLSEEKKKQFQYISDQDKIRYNKEQNRYEKEKGLPSTTNLTNFKKKQKPIDFSIRSRIPSPKLVEQISIDDDEDLDIDHNDIDIVEIQDNDEDDQIHEINTSDEQQNEISESQFQDLEDSLEDFQFQQHQNEMLKKIKIL